MNRYHCLKFETYRMGDYVMQPLEQSEMETIRKWRNGQLDILRQSQELTEKQQSDYYIKVILPSFEQKQPEQLLFGIHYQNNFIGYGGLTHIDWGAKSTELSFLNSLERVEDATLFRQDFFAFVEFSRQLTFRELQFDRLFAEVYEFRDEMIILLEEAGFKREGERKNSYYKKGKLINSFIYSKYC